MLLFSPSARLVLKRLLQLETWHCVQLALVPKGVARTLPLLRRRGTPAARAPHSGPLPFPHEACRLELVGAALVAPDFKRLAFLAVFGGSFR